MDPRRRHAALLEASDTKVAQVMTRRPATVTPTTSVLAATELMLQNGLGRVPVVGSGGELLGILSQADLLRVQPTNGHIVAVGEVMHVKALAVNEGTSLAHAAELLAVHRIHSLPVVDGAGKLVGVVSALDVVAWVAGL